MPGRQYSSNSYRYGFNGKENDNEVVGTGQGTQDYGMRIYNPQLGKFLSVDPIANRYPWYTPYQFSGDNPILFIDLDGLEPASQEQKNKAIIKVNEYFLNKNTVRVYYKINKVDFVDDMYGQLASPEKSTMPVTGEYYCGLYAFAYVFTYYSPDIFVKGAIDLFQTGKANINGINISSSKALKEQQPTKNIALYIVSATTREHYNKFTDAGSNKFWSSTASNDMKNFLTNIAGLKVSEYSYGHESVGEGITDKDMINLQSHLGNGNLAMLRVSYDQFTDKEGDSKMSGGGAPIISGKGGDHWIVLQKINFIKDGKISVDVYDNHDGLKTRTFDYDAFKNMIFHVLKLEPNKEEGK